MKITLDLICCLFFPAVRLFSRSTAILIDFPYPEFPPQLTPHGGPRRVWIRDLTKIRCGIRSGNAKYHNGKGDFTATGENLKRDAGFVCLYFGNSGNPTLVQRNWCESNWCALFLSIVVANVFLERKVEFGKAVKKIAGCRIFVKKYR